MIKLMFKVMKVFSLYCLLVNHSILKLLSLIEYYKFRLQNSRVFFFLKSGLEESNLPSLALRFQLLFKRSCVECTWIPKNTDCFAVYCTFVFGYSHLNLIEKG